MRVDIWSDVVCPWCYIGKRHFEAALAEFPHRDEVELVWHSFQLDPCAPPVTEGDPVDNLASRYRMSREQALAAQARVTGIAAQAGLEYHLDRARPGNTFTAHRLLHLALDEGRQDELKERLMRGYFTEGASIGDVDTLVRLCEEASLDPVRARAVAEGSEYTGEVEADVAIAHRVGIGAVPFFVIDAAIGVSGAQPPEVILSALTQAWELARPAAS